MSVENLKIYPDISHSGYHSDIFHNGPPTLSQSYAHTINSLSERHAWARHPRLGKQVFGYEDKQTEAMITGTILHSLILGGGQEIVLLNYDNFRTKESQIKRDEAVEAGLIPILAHKYEELEGIALETGEAITGVFGNDFIESKKELSVTFDYNGAFCKSRIDSVFQESNLTSHVLDLKFSRKGSPGGMKRSLVEFGYAIQAGLYTELGAAITGTPECIFSFIVTDLNFPRTVTRYKVSSRTLEYGMSLWRKAVAKWNKCMSEDFWPSFPDSTLEIPEWAEMLEAIDSESIDI